ncbi:MAG: hypothetical protein JHC95_07130 [Solirubrobacteraceae bacterium]|nr:hypothetical protein [Solirubrobacteraceae bacterium]
MGRRYLPGTVLFAKRFWAGIEDGSITVTYRTWATARVIAGRRYRTRAGVLEVDDIRRVPTARLTAADARRAGYADRAALLKALREADDVWRVTFHHAGTDPRIALRGEVPDADGVAALVDRLDAMDRRARDGAWTVATMDAIAAQPGVLAADIAASLGREKLPFKRDVRRLKELGLTESLPVGYRLSPRGEAVREARRRS